jgi:hypothetical protein
MPTPDIRSEIIRGPLADASTLFKNRNYIADQAFPIKDGISHKALYYKYRRGDWFRDEAALRAPGTKAKRGDMNLESVNVTTKQYAFAKAVTREDVESEGFVGAPPVNMQQDAIEYCADKVDLKKEIRTAALIRATDWNGVGAGGEDVEGKWARTEAAATNTFFSDIRKATIKIQSETGMTPNKLILDYRTMEDLKENPLVAEKIKYTMKNVVTADLLGSLLGVQILVGSAIQNTEPEIDGADAMTAKYIWENTATKGSAFLFYAPNAMGLKVPTAGGQFRIKQSGGSGRLSRVFREEAEDQWVYETREDTDIVAIATQLGYDFKDTILT